MPEFKGRTEPGNLKSMGPKQRRICAFPDSGYFLKNICGDFRNRQSVSAAGYARNFGKRERADRIGSGLDSFRRRLYGRSPVFRLFIEEILSGSLLLGSGPRDGFPRWSAIVDSSDQPCLSQRFRFRACPGPFGRGDGLSPSKAGFRKGRFGGGSTPEVRSFFGGGYARRPDDGTAPGFRRAGQGLKKQPLFSPKHLCGSPNSKF